MASESSEASSSGVITSKGNRSGYDLLQSVYEKERNNQNPAQGNKLSWFREIGATSTDPVVEKRIWSPDFENFYGGRKWGEGYRGRTWLRAWGRFVVGAAFFSAAQLYGNKALADYTGNNPKGLLQRIAYGIDKTVGRGIKAVFGDNAVMFHEKRDFGYKNAGGGVKMGRSLGHEAVTVTFDFAAMSFGDYMTRYFVSLWDPHNKTKWVKNGHLDAWGGIKEVGTNLFRAVTYASGEDMFVAIPYVYYMKLSRHFIDKFSPGFKYDSDRSMFGGSFKVNDKKQVIGDYNMEGIVDITGRFSIYNVGTKMFRDLYANIQEIIMDSKHGRNGDIVEKKFTVTPVKLFQHAARYTLVTATKMIFLMIPSAFLFAVLRTPQYKKSQSGLLIHPQKGEVGRLGEGMMAGASPRQYFSNAMYTDGNKPPWYSRITNPIGKGAYDLARQYEKGFNKINVPGLLDATKLTAAFGQPDGKTLTTEFTNRYVDAAVSYFPYFLVKSDWMTAYYDTNRTDFVLGGFYGSVWGMAKAIVSFKGNNIRSAAYDVNKWWDEVLLAMFKQPSPHYETQIQQVMNDQGYKSSNEAFDIYQGEQNYTRTDENAQKLNGNELLHEVQSIEAYKEAIRNSTPNATGVETMVKKEVAQGDDQTLSDEKKDENEEKSKKFTDRIQPKKPVAPSPQREQGWAETVQLREPVARQSLFDRISSGDPIMPPGSNAIN